MIDKAFVCINTFARKMHLMHGCVLVDPRRNHRRSMYE